MASKSDNSVPVFIFVAGWALSFKFVLLGVTAQSSGRIFDTFGLTEPQNQRWGFLLAATYVINHAILHVRWCTANRFYISVQNKQCKVLDMAGKPCGGVPELRNKTTSPFLGCSNFWKKKDVQGKHMLISFPDTIDADILVKLFTNQGAFQVHDPTASNHIENISSECKYLVPARSGVKGEAACRTWFLDIVVYMYWWLALSISAFRWIPSYPRHLEDAQVPCANPHMVSGKCGWQACHCHTIERT